MRMMTSLAAAVAVAVIAGQANAAPCYKLITGSYNTFENGETVCMCHGFTAVGNAVSWLLDIPGDDPDFCLTACQESAPLCASTAPLP